MHFNASELRLAGVAGEGEGDAAAAAQAAADERAVPLDHAAGGKRGAEVAQCGCRLCADEEAASLCVEAVRMLRPPEHSCVAGAVVFGRLCVTLSGVKTDGEL